MVICYLARKRIGAYLDGALEGAAATRVATHLTSCASCQREAEELRRLRGLLQRSLAVAEPDWTGFWPGVVRGIQDARQEVRAPARRQWWQPRWALGGALAAAVLATLTWWQMGGGPGDPRDSRAPVIVSSAQTELPGGRVMVYSTPERDVTVIWVLGLEQ